MLTDLTTTDQSIRSIFANDDIETALTPDKGTIKIEDHIIPQYVDDTVSKEMFVWLSKVVVNTLEQDIVHNIVFGQK